MDVVGCVVSLVQSQIASVAIMHRQEMVRNALKAMLKPHFAVAAEAGSVEDGEKQFPKKAIQLALIELSASGIRLAKRLAPLPVLFTTGPRPPLDLLLMSLEFEAAGCVCVDEPDDVVRGCSYVLAKKPYITPDTSVDVIRELHNRCHNVRLTHREVEILRLLSEGLPVTRAASSLGLSISTVKSHLSRAYQKLGVNRRDQATAAAASLGLLGRSRAEAG